MIFVGGISAQLEGEEMTVDYDGFKGGDRTKPADCPPTYVGVGRVSRIRCVSVWPI